MSARSVLCASLMVSTLLGSVLAGNAFASRSSSQHATAGAHLSLKNPGYLTVGSDTTYPPMESLDPRTHQAVGADVDLANLFYS